MTKRYLGNIITQNPTPPAGSYENDAASGVWSLAEAFAYTKAGLWPIAGNVAQNAFFAGGYNSGPLQQIDKIDITTTGNSIDFGDLSAAEYLGGSSSSSTRAIIGGGDQTNTNILYFTMSSGGATGTFGNLSQKAGTLAGASNSTRGLMLGGFAFINQNVWLNNIQYVTIATTGNSVDFGDLTVARSQDTATANATRAVCAGGNAGDNPYNVMDYVTISSTGNALDFGDLLANTYRAAGAASSTRGVFAGGGTPSNTNVIQYITLSSTGNAVDFGDLTVARNQLGGTSGTTRSVFGGGTGGTNVIDYITTATTANAVDFGDLAQAREQATQTAATAHGGLAA
jgi:hypothetical protein